MVKAGLEAGEDINAPAVTGTGETALHVSAIYCKNDVIKALIDAGADVNAKAGSGKTESMTPLHWFVNMNRCNEEAV